MKITFNKKISIGKSLWYFTR